MPIYEYHCPKCKKTHEVIQKVSDPPMKKCPSCGGKLKKGISPAAFHLKGGGWYKDGYATPKPEEKKASEGTTETKKESSESKPKESSGTETKKSKKKES